MYLKGEPENCTGSIDKQQVARGHTRPPLSRGTLSSCTFWIWYRMWSCNLRLEISTNGASNPRVSFLPNQHMSPSFIDTMAPVSPSPSPDVSSPSPQPHAGAQPDPGGHPFGACASFLLPEDVDFHPLLVFLGSTFCVMRPLQGRALELR